MSLVDLTNVKDTNFDLIPEGEYPVRCVSSEVKETKDGTGEYINCRFELLTGPHNGRTIWSMFNIKNKNSKAVEIGLAQLKAFMKAAGSKDFVLASATDLEGMSAVASITSKTDSFGEKNVIKFFKAPSKKEKEIQKMVDEKLPF